MKNSLSAWVVGFLFAMGLGLSGMSQPSKVIGFLDIFGSWDPSLIFVMIGAISVHFIAYKLIRKRTSPLFSSEWHVPQKNEITKSLVLGSVLFGIGWGLAGYCPGPALTSLGSAQGSPLVFVVGLVGGMYIFKFLDRKYHFKR